MKAHLLFEQSGTFKNAFKKYGIEAYDYDILNDFGETDYQIDLFEEIQKAYVGGQSVFDSIAKDDVCLAFFPCTRFEDSILLAYRGEQYQMAKWNDEKKLTYDLKLHSELAKLYEAVTKLALVAINRGIKLIIENPYSEQHYLRRYWCLKPKIIDRDRTKNGDYYTKPTQYYFINCGPKQNLVWEPLEYVKKRDVERTRAEGRHRQIMRSLIHPQYADRFIRQYILEEEQWQHQNRPS